MSIRYLTIHGTYKSIRLRNAALCIVALCIGLGQQPTFPIPLPLPVLSYFLTKVPGKLVCLLGADLPQTCLFSFLSFFKSIIMVTYLRLGGVG